MTALTSPSVTLTLESNNYKNTIVYGPDMNIMYWIETEGGKMFGTNPTQIYRSSPKGSRELIAVLEFHRYSATHITYQGETRDLGDLFPKKSWPRT